MRSSLLILILFSVSSCNSQTESQPRTKYEPSASKSSNQNKKSSESETEESGNKESSNETDTSENDETNSSQETNSGTQTNDTGDSLYVSDPFFEELTETYCYMTFTEDVKTTVKFLLEPTDITFKKGDKLLVGEYVIDRLTAFFSVDSGIISFNFDKFDDNTYDSNCTVFRSVNFVDTVGVAIEDLDVFEDEDYTNQSCSFSKGETFEVLTKGTTPKSEGVYEIMLRPGSKPDCAETVYFSTEKVLVRGNSFASIKILDLRLK